ncbi:hypothetical protein BofuT4_P024950.1 [Botrytis cinerea T4]|uniref:Uncharacterized protein n=1 Tax=Botryotinia fuckeliana (strain T4) TaxID=999810 RepID=G2YE98_BOTF4|nr:hypothetical protein BofuT4_P024950.1 [Botrytis cinerea T4]
MDSTGMTRCGYLISYRKCCAMAESDDGRKIDTTRCQEKEDLGNSNGNIEIEIEIEIEIDIGIGIGIGIGVVHSHIRIAVSASASASTTDSLHPPIHPSTVEIPPSVPTSQIGLLSRPRLVMVDPPSAFEKRDPRSAYQDSKPKIYLAPTYTHAF